MYKQIRFNKMKRKTEDYGKEEMPGVRPQVGFLMIFFHIAIWGAVIER